MTFVCIHITLIKEQKEARQDNQNQVDEEEQKEGHKCVMIADSNAVVNPWTVMIESFNTAIADGTVAGARCSYNLAVWAKFTWMHILQQRHKVQR